MEGKSEQTKKVLQEFVYDDIVGVIMDHTYIRCRVCKIFGVWEFCSKCQQAWVRSWADSAYH